MNSGAFSKAASQLRQRGKRMTLVALEVNFALWGMLICAEIEVAQYFLC
jgi:hypothetical protein